MRAGWTFGSFLVDVGRGYYFLSFAVAPHPRDGRAIVQTHSQIGEGLRGGVVEVR